MFLYFRTEKSVLLIFFLLLLSFILHILLYYLFIYVYINICLRWREKIIKIISTKNSFIVKTHVLKLFSLFLNRKSVLINCITLLLVSSAMRTVNLDLFVYFVPCLFDLCTFCTRMRLYESAYLHASQLATRFVLPYAKIRVRKVFR